MVNMSQIVSITILCALLALHSFSRTASASLAQDWFTEETTRTYNGAVPRTTCPQGSYRPAGGTDLASVSALRVDGCILCPRGKYGDTEGETGPECSGSCPLGKFSDRTGLTDVNDCRLCPSGRYGASIAMSHNRCTAACAAGKWSAAGSTSAAHCISCEFNLSGKKGGCTQDMTPHEPLH